MRQLDLPAPEAYRAYLESHAAEWETLDACCRITISRLYRDRGVFDYLGREILPRLAQAAAADGSRQIRCWSAGCASGEEAYTLAILGQLGLADVRLRILATDVDEHMIHRLRQGRYLPSSVKDVPANWLSGPLVRVGSECVVREEVRRHVEFQRQDIRHSLPDGPFQLVLCRNLVFTYFVERLQRVILRKILDRISLGGVLVIGKHERLPVPEKRMTPCGRNLGVFRISEGHKTLHGTG
jgi:chemotaxis protein methyltransferase CheR